MKHQQIFISALLVTLMAGLSGCEVVEGIFKAGFWTAIIIIVLIVALVFWLIRKGRS